MSMSTPKPVVLPKVEIKSDEVKQSYANKAKSTISFTLACAFHPSENWMNCAACNKVESKPSETKSIFDQLAIQYKMTDEVWRKKKIAQAAALLKQALAVNQTIKSTIEAVKVKSSKKKTPSQLRRDERRKKTKEQDHSDRPDTPDDREAAMAVLSDPPSLTRSIPTVETVAVKLASVEIE